MELNIIIFALSIGLNLIFLVLARFGSGSKVWKPGILLLAPCSLLNCLIANIVMVLFGNVGWMVIVPVISGLVVAGIVGSIVYIGLLAYFISSSE